MKYDLSGLYPEEFEKLVTGLCVEIFGVAVQHFSTGKDGGRDAYYNGFSKLFSKEGKHVIQAKHSDNPISSFSDARFFSNDKSTIKKEIPKIKSLKDAGRLDFYILFSNRKLSSLTSNEITQYISQETGLQESAIYLVGIEMIDEHLRLNVELPKKYGVDFFYSPLTIIPDELGKVIQAFSTVLTNIEPREKDDSLTYLDLLKKNEVNNLSQDYFKHIQDTAFSFFALIDLYLSDPLNEFYYNKYVESTEHLQQKVLTELANGVCMDSILTAINYSLIKGDSYLGSNKKLTRVFLYYMYCTCDIGRRA
ncbi:MAG: hypothetical protein Q8M98_04440 [Candidatus Cloacimonadaceae bacterium]|nr:hypothetical protein [Candidatus Cloacimonadaceae bacterium]